MKIETRLEICKFIIVGGGVAILHLVFVYFLTSILGWWYFTGSVFSYTCAIVLNFFLQKYFVRKNSEAESTGKQFFSFVLLALFCLGSNMLFSYILVSIFLWNYLLVQALIVLALAVATFLINRNFIFSH